VVGLRKLKRGRLISNGPEVNQDDRNPRVVICYEKNRMELTEGDLEQVGNYVQMHLFEWLPAPVVQLSERIIRVEEELKAQRDLMKQGFEQMEKRFEQVDKRFEQVDKRFEQVDKRFEQADKRFDDFNRRFTGMMWLIGTGFVLLSTLMSLYAFFT